MDDIGLCLGQAAYDLSMLPSVSSMDWLHGFQPHSERFRQTVTFSGIPAAGTFLVTEDCNEVMAETVGFHKF